jgi:hypothetical protein
MKNQDPELLSAHESITSDRAEPATLAGNLEALLQRSQQLNEYCDRAVAEIRASLELTQNHSN